MAPTTARLLEKLPPRVLRTGANLLFGLPRPLKRLIAGSPLRRDGQRLDLDMQLLVRIQQLGDLRMVGSDEPTAARAALAASNALVAGARVPDVDTRNVTVPAGGGTVPARLYTPDGIADPSGLLVFYHGGGWVLCDMDTHDNVCRALAVEAGVRVLSVDYRLAPEHPFPAAVEDSLTAYRYAAEHAAELGADPAAIAVGGDSAGGNLAAVVAHLAARDERAPAFQLLAYPATDATVRRRSRELFREGLFLTDSDMDWFMDRYAPDPTTRGDPRLSVLLAEDLSGVCPAYVTTAGFDPLRDEGEAYAARLAESGVPVTLHRHRDLIHGFLNFLVVGPRPRQALAAAAGALRTGLALRTL